MKANKISVLALTGLILVVFASGTAFAQDWSKYSGISESTYTAGNPSWVQTSSGGKGPVAVGDALYWDNTMNNGVSRAVTVYVGGLTMPSGGLNYNEVPVQVSASSTGYDNNHKATVAIKGGHTIQNYHGYQDGMNYYSVNAQDMSYT